MNAYIILQKKLFRFLFSHVFPFSCALSLEQKWLQVRRILSLDPSKYKNGRLPFGLKPDKGVALTEGADLEEKRRNDKPPLQHLVFHICVFLGGLHFLGLWQEEVERLREIIERLKEENDQLTRQLEVWQCKFYLFYIVIQQTFGIFLFLAFLSLWCFSNFLPCFASLIFCDGANRQPGPQPSGGRPNLWSSRRNWRTNPRQTGKVSPLENITGRNHWNHACFHRWRPKLRLKHLLSSAALICFSISTHKSTCGNKARGDTKADAWRTRASDSRSFRWRSEKAWTFDSVWFLLIQWSNVNSFVQRCSFLFAFLVSFCVTEATGRAREGPNDLNACYRCRFFLQFFQFSLNAIWKHFASWGLQSQNCRLGKANQRLGEWA